MADGGTSRYTLKMCALTNLAWVVLSSGAFYLCADQAAVALLIGTSHTAYY